MKAINSKGRPVTIDIEGEPGMPFTLIETEDETGLRTVYSGCWFSGIEYNYENVDGISIGKVQSFPTSKEVSFANNKDIYAKEFKYEAW